MKRPREKPTSPNTITAGFTPPLKKPKTSPSLNLLQTYQQCVTKNEFSDLIHFIKTAKREIDYPTLLSAQQDQAILFCETIEFFIKYDTTAKILGIKADLRLLKEFILFSEINNLVHNFNEIQLLLTTKSIPSKFLIVSSRIKTLLTAMFIDTRNLRQYYLNDIESQAKLTYIAHAVKILIPTTLPILNEQQLTRAFTILNNIMKGFGIQTANLSLRNPVHLPSWESITTRQHCRLVPAVLSHLKHSGYNPPPFLNARIAALSLKIIKNTREQSITLNFDAMDIVRRLNLTLNRLKRYPKRLQHALEITSLQLFLLKKIPLQSDKNMRIQRTSSNRY